MRTFFIGLSVSFCIILVLAFPLSAETDKAACAQEEIVVKNLTLIDLKYKKGGGNCTALKRAYQFVMKPEETVEIFSDLICEKPYCSTSFSYQDLRYADTDGNCRVRILPNCTLSDM
jgi:hypothetical protein